MKILLTAISLVAVFLLAASTAPAQNDGLDWSCNAKVTLVSGQTVELRQIGAKYEDLAPGFRIHVEHDGGRAVVDMIKFRRFTRAGKVEAVKGNTMVDFKYETREGETGTFKILADYDLVGQRPLGSWSVDFGMIKELVFDCTAKPLAQPEQAD